MPFQPSSAWLWHFDMLRDHVRNRAYREAIESAVREYARRCAGATAPPPLRVLDIGTGTGLLATLVARAAAAALPEGSRGRVEIVAFEVVPAAAEIAAATFARNGARVQLVRAHSTDARAGGCVAPCDLLVAELLDTALLGEGALASVRAAAGRAARGGGAPTLLRPGFASVPAAASVVAQLVSCGRYRRMGWLLDDDELEDDGDNALPPIRCCLLYTSPSPRDATLSRMPSSA